MQNRPHSSKFYGLTTSFEQLQKLVNSNQYDINSNLNGSNALHASILFPAIIAKKRITLLLTHGINVNCIERHSRFYNTPLHAFIVNERVSDAIYLIDEAKRLNVILDLKARDFEGKTALILAAKMRKEQLALYILENSGENLDINSQDNSGMTAAHYACALSMPKLLEALIRKQANLSLQCNKKRKPIDCLDLSDDEIRQILDSVFVNPNRDENAQRNEITDEYSQLIESLDKLGKHKHKVLAIKANRAVIAKIFERTIVDFSAVLSMMYQGVKMTQEELHIYLAKHCLTVEQKQNILKQFDDMSGVTVLQAIKEKRPAVRQTLLILATKRRQEEIALHILENGGDNFDLDTQDIDGMTAAHYACALGMPKLLEALIKKKADLTKDCKKKRKPIDYLTVSQDELEGILKSASINPHRDEHAVVNYICDENLQKPITLDLLLGTFEHDLLAVTTNRATVEQILERDVLDRTRLHGDLEKNKFVNDPEMLKSFAKHVLSRQQKLNILKQFDHMSGVTVIDAVKRDQITVKDILITHGVSYDRLIRTYAANNKSTELSSLLTRSDISKHINQPGLPSLKTALHHAAAKGFTEICTQLIDAHASLDCQDADENTPLLLACQGRHEGIVLLLIEKGADVAKKNKQGFNIFQIMKNTEQNQLHLKVLALLNKCSKPLPAEIPAAKMTK